MAADIGDQGVEEMGRVGMSVDWILRCALLKHYRQLNYDELALPSGCVAQEPCRATIQKRPLLWWVSQ